MRRLAILALAAGLSGCITPLGDFEPDPELTIAGPLKADEAIALIAASLDRSRTGEIYWYGKKALTCDDGERFPSPIGCVYGFTMKRGSIVSWDEEQPPSATPLTHEIVHQFRGDPGHRDTRLWGTNPQLDDYEPGSLVGDINATLIAAGL
jgi:hypothetical protein